MATNFEVYENKIIDWIGAGNCPGFLIAGIKGVEVEEICAGHACYECRKTLAALLAEEHTELPKLTKRERAFCEYMGDGYVARDQDGNLNWYDLEPSKEEETDDIYGEWRSRAGCYAINAKKSTFAFITWSNEKPWAVEDLLKLEVIEE